MRPDTTPTPNNSNSNINNRNSHPDGFVPYCRSKTVLLLVHQLPDVAPVAAICALLGDLHRHRTLFAANSNNNNGHTNEPSSSSPSPTIVVRVAVVPSLRHYFVVRGDDDNGEKIVSWRAHEMSKHSSSSFLAAPWATHVGAPDSIWTLNMNDDDDDGDAYYYDSGLEEAFYGRRQNSTATTTTSTAADTATAEKKKKKKKLWKNNNSFLSHDDGGMADMILVGHSSSLSLSMWKNIAHLMTKATHDAGRRRPATFWNGATSSAAPAPQQTPPPPPIVIATLGNLRGQDWLSRMAFFARKTPTESHGQQQRQQWNEAFWTTTMGRPLCLVGFPEPLWYCRIIPDSSNSVNANRKIRTRFHQEDSIVLMVGRRESSSIHKQDVCLVQQTSSHLPDAAPAAGHEHHRQLLLTAQQDQVLLLLRQTLFPPNTELEIMPPHLHQLCCLTTAAATIPTTIRNNNRRAKPYIYTLLWTLLQDPHMIQLPCYMAVEAAADPAAPSSSSDDPTRQHLQQRQRRTVGALILSVFEELISVLHSLHTLISIRQQQSNNNGNAARDNALLLDDDFVVEESLCESVTHPLEASLLAKLLGKGCGTLMEDLTHNRMTDLVVRLRLSSASRNNKVVDNDDGDDNDDDLEALSNVVRQRWILEPLLTRAALSEWHFTMQQSPYPPASSSSTTTTTNPCSACPALVRQVQNDCIQYGLGLVLQLGQLLRVEKQRLSTTQWVVERVGITTYPAGGVVAERITTTSSSAVPLHAFRIETMQNLLDFLTQYPPLGGGAARRDTSISVPMLSKL